MVGVQPSDDGAAVPLPAALVAACMLPVPVVRVVGMATLVWVVVIGPGAPQFVIVPVVVVGLPGVRMVVLVGVVAGAGVGVVVVCVGVVPTGVAPGVAAPVAPVVCARPAHVIDSKRTDAASPATGSGCGRIFI